MTGLKQRILRRRAPGSPGRSDAGFVPRLKAGASRLRPRGGAGRLKGKRGGRLPWGKRAARQPALAPGQQPGLAAGQQPGLPPGQQPGLLPGQPPDQQPGLPPGRQPGLLSGEPRGLAPGDGATAVSTAEVVDTTGSASFRDRGRLRRRLRFLRRARELAFRDVGGLIFDMRRFGRDRPDLVEAKLAALGAVDRELRALERVLDDRRPIHELREPGLSSCPRCGALHASEDNFCPRCGLQFGGAQAMGEVGGAIAAPPQAPPAPIEQPTAATLIAPGSGLEQAATQTGQAVPTPRQGLFVDGTQSRPPAPPGGPGPSAHSAPGPATPTGGPPPSADGGQGHPAAPAGGPGASADGAQGRPATPPDRPGPGPGGAEDSSPEPDRPAAGEQQTEIFRPHDAS